MALFIHNLEEALTFDRFRGPSSDLLSTLAGFRIVVPPTPTFLTALLLVTIVGAMVALWASRSPPTPAKRTAIGAFAVILLLNVAMPHVPAAMMLGGYAPGVASALFINAPVAIFVIAQLRRAGRQ